MNTKAKIWLGVIGGAVLIGGTLTIVNAVRKRRILDDIYDSLNAAGGTAGTYAAGHEHKALSGFDPNFWKKTSGSPLPSRLIPDKKARLLAKRLYDDIYQTPVTEDEEGILSTLKEIESHGQLSQVTYWYNKMPLNAGDLADALNRSFSEEELKEMNSIVFKLPN